VSDESGQYLLENLPAGVYNVFGQLYVGDELYLDILSNVIVEAGALTQYANLVLH
jgi:hypothetical protein